MERIAHLITHNREEILTCISKEDQPSTFEDYVEFQLLILRRLHIVDGNMVLWSEVFIFAQDAIHYYERENDKFVAISGIVELSTKLKSFYENNQKIVLGYSNEVEGLEDLLFDRNIPRHFMDLWFSIKKDLTRFENFYYRNKLVFKEFQKFADTKFPKDGSELGNVYDSIAFQNSNVLALISRLDSVHHYYDSIKNERLNSTIFTLTIISAIFLPMNLIVGFFGMNTEGLFFTGNPQGTTNVIYVLGGITLTMLLGLRVIKALNHYFLRFLLGRFNFYKRISKRFEEVEKRVTGH